MSEPLIWQLVRAIADSGPDAAPLLARAVERSLYQPGTKLSTSTLLNLLEEAGSMLSVDEAIGILQRAAVLDQDLKLTESLSLGEWTFDLSAVSSAIDSSRATVALDRWTLEDLLDRVHDWSDELAGVVEREALPGVPTFWECQSSDSNGVCHAPVDVAIGSMSTFDLMALWCETSEASRPSPGASVLALVERSLALQAPAGSPFAGAIYLRHFDDDFVHNFDASKGSHPTVEATANACSAWALILHRGLPEDLHGRVVAAIRCAVEFLLASQRDDGSWGLGSDHAAGLSASPVSVRFATLALADAIDGDDILTDASRSQVSIALDGIADFLLQKQRADGLSWASSFLAGGGDRMLETTALLLLPVLRLGPRIDSGLVTRATRFVRAGLANAETRILEAKFRVPTWQGVSSAFQTWELPFDAVVVSAIMSLPEPDPDDIDHVRSAMGRIVRGEKHGHWYDLGGAAVGKQRAFPSNSLINVRAVRDWCVASRRP